MIIFYALFLLALIYLLIKSADLVVDSLRKFTTLTHAKTVVVSSILLAMATSFPELVIGVTSAIDNSPDLTLGNVIGANIANISLVAGLSALITGGVIIHSNYIKREVLIAAVAALIPLLLVSDGTLSRIDGILLILFYVVYTASFFKDRFLQLAQSVKSDQFAHRFISGITPKNINIDFVVWKELLKMFLSIGFMILVASVSVDVALNLAIIAKIPIFIVGLILLSMGTTLPELAFSIRSLKKNQPMMYFGNILGSIITNSTLVLGLTSIIFPIKLSSPVESVVAAVSFLLIFGLFWYFIKSKMRIERKEAAVLLVLYFFFVAATFFLS